MIQNFTFWYYDHKPKLIEDLEYIYGRDLCCRKIESFKEVEEYNSNKINILVFYWDGLVHNRADKWKTKELWTWHGFTYTVPFMLFLNSLHAKGFITIADYLMESDTAMKAEYYYFFELMRELGVDSKKLIFCYNNSYSLKMENVIGDRYRFKTLHFPHFYISTRRHVEKTSSTGSKNKVKLFSCFNGKVRPHKLDFIQMLVNKGLLDKTYLTMIRIPLDTQGLIGIREDYRKTLSYLKLDLTNFKPRTLPHDPASLEEVLNFTYKTNRKWYDQVKVDLVTETWYKPMLDERWKCWHPMVHLTEKTWKPIAFGTPFIVSATPGHLSTLRKFGFQTFDNIIDESYDTLPDDIRMKVALEQGIKLAEMHNLPETQEVCNFNSTRFFDDNHRKFIVEEFFLKQLLEHYKRNDQTGS